MPIAGIWRRLAAFAIDGFILAFPAFVAGLTFFDWAVSFGQLRGRILGFVVALLYFGIMDSRIARGQTLGKHVLDLQVVDRAGEFLTPLRAALRYLVLGVPFFLNGLWLEINAGHVLNLLLQSVLSLAVFGGFGAIVYLFLFNRRTRQSLHDLAVGSFVARSPSPPAPLAVSIARRHLVLVGGWLALTLIAPVVGDWAIRGSSVAASLKPLAELTTAIEGLPGLSFVRVQKGKLVVASVREGKTTTSFLQVNAASTAAANDIDSLERTVAAKVLALHPDLLGQEVLVIQVQRRFDFFVATWTENNREAWTAEAWKAKLAVSSPSRS